MDGTPRTCFWCDDCIGTDEEEATCAYWCRAHGLPIDYADAPTDCPDWEEEGGLL